LGTRKKCVFCEILRGRAPARIVAENRRAVALLDIQPYAAGHSLVISRRHVPFWHDLDEEEVIDIFRLARQVAQLIKKALRPEFVSLYARGRRIPHTHIFLVPTRKGEPFDRHFNALEGFQEGARELAGLQQPQRLDEIKELLLAARKKR